MTKYSSVLLLASFFCATPLIHADEAAKKTKIEQIFALANIDKLLSQNLSMIGNQIKSAALQRTFRGPLSPDQQKLENEFQDKLMQMVTPLVSWNNLKPTYVNAYAKTFTDNELDGILAFYKSPAGQALVTKSPQLMTDANRTVQQNVVALQPKIQLLMKEYMAKSRTVQPAKQ